MAQNNFTPLDPDLAKTNGQSSGLSNKEAEPISSSSGESFEISEIVEHKPEEELGRYIHSKPETANIDEETKAMGVVSTAQIKFPAEEKIKLPFDMTDSQIEEGLHKPVTSSWRWLAEFCKHLLQKAHIALKTVHGKIIRVVSK